MTLIDETERRWSSSTPAGQLPLAAQLTPDADRQLWAVDWTAASPMSGGSGRVVAPQLNGCFASSRAKTPPERGFSYKRLKGLEPSTFCMA
ncbi:MAG: hypothetical protein WAL22_04575, partial [Solirubrobacteraceae bacterium]